MTVFVRLLYLNLMSNRCNTPLMSNRGDSKLHANIPFFTNCSNFMFVLGYVINATFNDISLNVCWRSVLLLEETGEIHRPAASH